MSEGNDGSAGERAGAVVFELPAVARFARVARVAVAACASLEGFSMDELEDVRLLVDELFHALSGIGRGPVRMALVPADGTLAMELSAQRDGGHGGGWRNSDDPGVALVRTLLDVLADDTTIVDDDAQLAVRVCLSSRGVDRL